ncbi:MAG: hypothetical protein AAFZ18_27490 [Myxococcota bacterium]
MMMRRLVPLVLAAAALACDDDPPIPSGNLVRPSGLAFVARPNLEDPGCPLAEPACLDRSDVLVADSEAQGVRIIQYAETVISNGEIEDRPAFFVPAPVSFFKLAAESPGFPTLVTPVPAIATATVARPAHALVLSPASGQLHVLEIANTEYQAPATTDTNILIGSVDLFGPALGAGGVPVALELVNATAEVAVVAVLLDGLGQASGQLLLLQVDLTRPDPDDPGLLSMTQRIDVEELPAGSQDLVFRDEGGDRSLLVTNIEDDFIREISLAPGGGGFEGMPLSIDAFGPTLKLIDIGASGVLALRLDRSAAVWLHYDSATQAFIRPDTVLPSAYDDVDPSQRPSEPGVLTLRSPIAVTGAHARLSELNIPTSPDAVFENEQNIRQDVALIVHTDGFGTYVLGSRDSGDLMPPAPAVVGVPRLDRVFAAEIPNDGSDVGQADFTVDGCVVETTCDSNAISLSACETPELINRPFVGALAVRASPYGTLVQGTSAALRTTSTSTSGPITMEILDSRYENFDRHRLRLGDGVRVELELESCGPEDQEIEVTLVGTVTATGTGVDTRGFATVPAARVDAELQVARFEPATAFDDVVTDFRSACQAQLLDQNDSLFYEVHIPDDVDEAVLVQPAGEDVIQVLERAPISFFTSLPEPPNPPVFGSRMSFGTSPEATSPARLNINGAGRQEIACRYYETPADGETAPENVEGAGFCVSSTDCGGGGRICEGFVSGSCSGTCSTDCSGTDCFDARIARECPRLDAVIFGAPAVFDLRAAGLIAPQPQDLIQGAGTVPSDAVYHPPRGSFFVSFPGSRSLVEVSTTEPGIAPTRIR